MEFEMVVEQLGSQEYRMKYLAERNEFEATPYKFLGYTREFVGVYGWIVGFGTPPGKHLDVMVPTGGEFANGDVVSIRVIGCFKRSDDDDKYIAVEAARKETTFSDLPEPEQTMLKKQYPIIGDGERWLESDEALEMLERHRGQDA